MVLFYVVLTGKGVTIKECFQLVTELNHCRDVLVRPHPKYTHLIEKCLKVGPAKPDQPDPLLRPCIGPV